MLKKANVWISAVLYLLIIVTVLVIILGAILPILKNTAQKSNYIKSKELMLQLDSTIQQVASQGAGSQRTFSIELADGEITAGSNAVIYELIMDDLIVNPSASVQLGNLKIQGSSDVTSYQTSSYIILQNSRITVNISRIGSPSSFAAIDTANIINSISHGSDTTSNYQFLINNDAVTGTGMGYTQLLDEGSSLSLARVKSHVNASTEYDLIFSLQSEADFIQVDLVK